MTEMLMYSECRVCKCTLVLPIFIQHPGLCKSCEATDRWLKRISAKWGIKDD